MFSQFGLLSVGSELLTSDLATQVPLLEPTYIEPVNLVCKRNLHEEKLAVSGANSSVGGMRKVALPIERMRLAEYEANDGPTALLRWQPTTDHWQLATGNFPSLDLNRTTQLGSIDDIRSGDLHSNDRIVVGIGLQMADLIQRR